MFKNGTMVEKIARGLCANDTDIWADGDSPNDQELRRLYYREALAVLKVMRDATKEMIAAGDDAKEACVDSDYDSDADGNRYDYTTINSDLPAIVFRAMIDAAIAEAEDGIRV